MTKKIRLLLVEDDEIDRMNIQRALKDNEVFNSVETAEDGVDALEHLRTAGLPPPALILLDLNMPRMNGLEFLRELRADEKLKATPVVVLTTSNAEQDKVQAYDLNVAGYIVKPVTYESFKNCIGQLESYWSMNEFPTGD